MTCHFRCLRWLTVSLMFCVAFSGAGFGADSRDRTQVGSNINIGPGEEVSDATCFGCSVRVRGHVSSDVTAFGGSVIIEEDGRVDGDVTTFGGGVRLGKEANVGGDVTVFGGRIQRDPAATVGGDVTNMGGPGWMVLIVLTPFVFLGLFAALIVWIVRRLLRTAAPVAA
jgi:hypothetical protein